MTAVDRALDDLYGAPPREFVLVRARVERELRETGDQDAADEIRRRRPPPLAAWACNQLARHDLAGVGGLLSLTEQIASSQATLGHRGAEPDVLRQLTHERHQLLEQLADAAVRLLRDQTPKPDAHRATIANTLDAASATPELAPELGRGRLTATLAAPSGFGPLPGAERPGRAEARRKPSARDVDSARRALEEARRRADELHVAADTAAAEEISAQLEMETTAARVQEVREALTRTEESASAAARAADAARERSDSARRQAKGADEALEEARRRLADLGGG